MLCLVLNKPEPLAHFFLLCVMLYWKMTWSLQEQLVLTPSWLFADNSCSSLAFTCVRGGQCIPSQWRCDQHNDCLDGSDEQNCPTRPTSTCPSTSFTCDNHLCIPRDWVCDTDNDCSDGSDERNCGEFWAAFSGSLSLKWFEITNRLWILSSKTLSVSDTGWMRLL